MAGLSDVIDHPLFVGLWTYRPYGGTKKFCASVLVGTAIQETRMFDEWLDALKAAQAILNDIE